LGKNRITDTGKLKWLVSTRLLGTRCFGTAKNSAADGHSPIEKADQTHKRDLFGQFNKGS
jgi:hypothetical protein